MVLMATALDGSWFPSCRMKSCLMNYVKTQADTFPNFLCFFMWVCAALPHPSVGSWGISSAPKAPLMGRVSFLFAVSCAYFFFLVLQTLILLCYLFSCFTMSQFLNLFTCTFNSCLPSK